MTGTNWKTLATEVIRRRTQLQLRQTDVEKEGGPSAGTMRNIEQASRDSYAARTYVQLETALKWGDGVVRRILDGTVKPEELTEIVDRSPGATNNAALAANLPVPYAEMMAAVKDKPAVDQAQIAVTAVHRDLLLAVDDDPALKPALEAIEDALQSLLEVKRSRRQPA